MLRRAPARARRHLFVAAFAVLPVVLFAINGCTTDGTTPDCSPPDTHCGPDVDGAFGEGAAGETGADSPADGGLDALVDAPLDAPRDAKIDGDASPG